MSQVRKTKATFSYTIYSLLFFTLVFFSFASNAQLFSGIAYENNEICFEKSPFSSAKYIKGGVGINLQVYLMLKNIVFTEDGKNGFVPIDDIIEIYTDEKLKVDTAVITACWTEVTNNLGVLLSKVQISVSSDSYKKQWEESLSQTRAWLKRYVEKMRQPRRVGVPAQLR